MVVEVVVYDDRAFMGLHVRVNVCSMGLGGALGWVVVAIGCIGVWIACIVVGMVGIVLVGTVTFI
jgi:hypothetical protein